MDFVKMSDYHTKETLQSAIAGISYKKLISIDQELNETDRNKVTIDAIKKGYDLIYHAYLIDDNLRGESDFLIKTNISSGDTFLSANK